MKLGIMQPYFFPYIGYFSLIANTDHFVFFDTAQYETRSWMNRNRIINLNGGFTYITLALKKAPQKTPINGMWLADSNCWAEKLLAQLTIYKKRAPHYDAVIDLIRALGTDGYTMLSELNIRSTARVCDYLEIPLEYEVFSQMHLPIYSVDAPDEWALQITKVMGYDTYINPPGGMEFFNRKKYEDAGITLQFLQAELTPYVQKLGYFEGGLSILDVMMFCSPAEIRNMLNEFVIL